MKTELDLESKYPSVNPDLSRCKLWNYGLVTPVSFLYYQVRMTIRAASPNVNDKHINNICSKTKHSGLCSNFCWTWTSILLTLSNEYLYWLPWIPFYFITHKLGRSMDYLWSLTFLYNFLYFSFSTVIMCNFYNLENMIYK